MTMDIEGKKYKKLTERQVRNKIMKGMKIEKDKLNELVENKVKEFGFLITEIGALYIIASNNKVNLFEEIK